MADFEQETKAPKQLRSAEKNYATSWSSGIQRRTRFAVGALLGQKLASRVFEEPASVLLVWELMFGLRHTHALNIIHLDITLGNLCLTGTGRLKIGGFGCCEMGDGQQHQAGSARYHPPEMESSGQRPSQHGLSFAFTPSVPAVCHCHWPWRTCAPSLLHVKELRWRSDVLPLCSIVGSRSSRHCWRLLRRKRLAGGNDKARQGLRAALLHHMAAQTNRLILEKNFLYLRPLCFHWLRMIASTPLAQFHIHVDSLIGMTKPFLIEPRRNVPPWRSPCLLRGRIAVAGLSTNCGRGGLGCLRFKGFHVSLETMWDLDGSAVRKIDEWRIFRAIIRQDPLWQCRAMRFQWLKQHRFHTSWNFNYGCHLKLFDAEAVGNPICCNQVDCVCWSLLVVLLIVTYFLTRALSKSNSAEGFHDALGSCCMAKPLVLPGLVLRLLTLKFLHGIFTSDLAKHEVSC